MALRIVSWNINGIKSLKDPLQDIFKDLDGDIICFQEIKSSKDTIEQLSIFVDNYNSYLSFPKTRPGYSGVSIYSRNSLVPIYAEESLVENLKVISGGNFDELWMCQKLDIENEELESLDSEGRCVICEFELENDKNLAVINVYCPRVDPDNEDRIKFRKKFNKLLSLNIEAYLQVNYHVILVGDLNVSHTPKDLAEDVDLEIFKVNPSRKWLNNLLIDNMKWKELTSNDNVQSDYCYSKLIDTYRFKYPDTNDVYTCWNTKISGKLRNYGSRIDYILCDKNLESSIKHVEIMKDYPGSDHCPMFTEFTGVNIKSAIKYPKLCSCNLPRFRNQSKITNFLTKSNNNNKRSLQNNDDETKSTTGSKTMKISSIGEPKTIESKPLPSKAVEPVTCKNNLVGAWKNIFAGAPKVPVCTGHNEPAVLKKVSKSDSVHKGRQFWACSRLPALPNSKHQKSDSADKQKDEYSCGFFKWKN